MHAVSLCFLLLWEHLSACSPFLWSFTHTPQGCFIGIGATTPAISESIYRDGFKDHSLSTIKNTIIRIIFWHTAIYEECCAKKVSRAGTSNYIYNISRMSLLVPAIDTCFWNNTIHIWIKLSRILHCHHRHRNGSYAFKLTISSLNNHSTTICKLVDLILALHQSDGRIPN